MCFRLRGFFWLLHRCFRFSWRARWFLALFGQVFKQNQTLFTR